MQNRKGINARGIFEGQLKLYHIKSLENSGPWHICPLQRGGQEEVILTARLPSMIKIIVAKRLHVTKWKKDWEVKQMDTMKEKRLWDYSNPRI